MHNKSGYFLIFIVKWEEKPFLCKHRKTTEAWPLFVSQLSTETTLENVIDWCDNNGALPNIKNAKFSLSFRG